MRISLAHCFTPALDAPNVFAGMLIAAAGSGRTMRCSSAPFSTGRLAARFTSRARSATSGTARWCKPKSQDCRPISASAARRSTANTRRTKMAAATCSGLPSHASRRSSTRTIAGCLSSHPTNSLTCSSTALMTYWPSVTYTPIQSRSPRTSARSTYSIRRSMIAVGWSIRRRSKTFSI